MKTPPAPQVPDVDEVGHLTDPMPTVAADGVVAVDPWVPARTGLLRVGAGITVVQLALFAALNALSTVLLPVRIEQLAGASGKETWLGAITSAAAVATIVVGPVVGILSDRTRTRLGRRGPWVLAGGAGAAAALAASGAATSPAELLIAWCLALGSITALQAGLAPVLAERVPLRRRGLMSGATGFATTFAAVGGSALGAVLVGEATTGIAAMGVVIAVGSLGFVVIAPDYPSTGVKITSSERWAQQWRGAVGVFRVPNLRWTWIGRFLVTLGYQLLLLRMLYFLQARFGLGLHAAASSVAAVTASAGVFTVVGLVLSGPLSDKIGRLPFIYFGGAAAGAGLVGAAFAHSSAQFTLAWSVVSLAYGAFIGVDAALGADVLPNTENAARDLAVLNTATALPQAIAPAAGSLLLALSGTSYTLLILTAAAASFAGAAATGRLRGIR